MNTYLLLVLAAAILSALPLIMIKKYTVTSNYMWLLAAAIIFMILIFIYIQVINNNNISIIGPVIKIIEVILFVIAGMLLFNEKMDGRHLIGIFLGIVSIWLLSC